MLNVVLTPARGGDPLLLFHEAKGSKHDLVFVGGGGWMRNKSAIILGSLVISLLVAPLDARSDCKCKMHSDHFTDFWSQDRTNGMVVCGTLESKAKNMTISDGIEVSECLSGKSLLYVSEVDTCFFVNEKGSFYIVQCKKLPFGKNSSWIDAPCYRFSFRFSREADAEMKEAFVLKTPGYSEDKIRQVIRNYEKLKDEIAAGSPRFLDSNETENKVMDALGQMLACAIDGNKRAKEIMPEMGKALKVDALTAEEFDDVSEIYRASLKIH